MSRKGWPTKAWLWTAVITGCLLMPASLLLWLATASLLPEPPLAYVLTAAAILVVVFFALALIALVRANKGKPKRKPKALISTIILCCMCAWANFAISLYGLTWLGDLRDRPYIEAQYQSLTFNTPLKLVGKQWVGGHLLANAPMWIYTYEPLASSDQLAKSIEVDLVAAGYQLSSAPSVSLNDETLFANNPITHLRLEVTIPISRTPQSDNRLVIVRVAGSP